MRLLKESRCRGYAVLYKNRHEAVKTRNRIKILIISFCPIANPVSRNFLREEDEEEEDEEEEDEFIFFVGLLILLRFLWLLVITP